MQYDRPFLRPAAPESVAATPPPGWRAEPAGRDGHQHLEVVYDPARHGIIASIGRPLGPKYAETLVGQGWSCLAVGDDGSVWWQDRTRAAQRHLATRAAEAAPARPGFGQGLGHDPPAVA